MADLLLSPPPKLPERRPGLQHDPTTGLGYDPATGEWVDPTTGKAYNAATGQWEVTDLESTAQTQVETQIAFNVEVAGEAAKGQAGEAGNGQASPITDASGEKSAAMKRLEKGKEAKPLAAEEAFKVLGQSIKDAKKLGLRDVYRRRLFPYDFRRFILPIEEEEGVVAKSNIHLVQFLIFVVFGVSFLLLVMICIPTFDENSVGTTITSNILSASVTTPSLIKYPGAADAIQFDVRHIHTLSMLAMWMKEVIPIRLVPSVSNFNEVVGDIRITQRRMLLSASQYSSPLFSQLSASFPERWNAKSINPYYSVVSGVEDTRTFGGHDETFYYSHLDGFRGNGGFVISLDGRDKKTAMARIKNIMSNGFLDRRTTSLVIELVTKNSIVKAYSYTYIVFYISAVDGISVGVSSKVAIIEPFSTVNKIVGYFIFGACVVCTCLSVLSSFYFIYIEVSSSTWRKQFKACNGWDVLVAVRLLCAVTTVILFGVSRLKLVKDISNQESFQEIVYALENSYNVSTALNVFASITILTVFMGTIRFFSFLKAHHIRVVTWTFQRSVIPLLYIILGLFCSLLVFTLQTNLSYSQTIKGFSSFGRTLLLTMGSFFGQWPYLTEMQIYDSTMAALIVIPFICLLLLLVLNIICATVCKVHNSSSQDATLNSLSMQKQLQRVERTSWHAFKVWVRKIAKMLHQTNDSKMRQKRNSTQRLSQIADVVQNPYAFSPNDNIYYAGQGDPYGTSGAAPQWMMDYIGYRKPQDSAVDGPSQNRWDWYDPYNPPDAYDTSGAPPAEYFSRAYNASMPGFESYQTMGHPSPANPPSLKNVYNFTRASKTGKKHLYHKVTLLLFTSVLVAMLSNIGTVEYNNKLYDALTAVVLQQWWHPSEEYPIFSGSLNSRETYGQRQKANNVLSATTPSDFYSWSQQCLANIYFKTNVKQQPQTVFHSPPFPILIRNWDAAMSISAPVEILLTFSKNRESPDPTPEGFLEGLGFQKRKDEMVLYLPADESQFQAKIEQLVGAHFVRREATSVTYKVPLFAVNALMPGLLDILFQFHDEGKVRTEVSSRTFGSPFFGEGPLFGLFITFSVCVVLLTIFEILEFRLVYKQLQLFEARAMGISKISLFDSVMVWLFDKNIFESLLLPFSYSLEILIILTSQQSFLKNFKLPWNSEIRDLNTSIENVTARTDSIYNLGAWTCVVAFANLIVVAKQSKTIQILSIIMKSSFLKIGSSFLIFAFGYLTFCFAIYFVCGRTLTDFSSPGSSLYNGILVINGQYPFKTLIDDNPLFTGFVVFPILVCFYVNFFLFVAIFIRSFKIRESEADEASRMCKKVDFNQPTPATNKISQMLVSLKKSLDPSTLLKFHREKPTEASEEPVLLLSQIEHANRPKAGGVPQWDTSAKKKENAATHEACDDFVKVAIMTNQQWHHLDENVKTWANANAVDFIDRFRKYELGSNLSVDAANFLEQLEDKLHEEMKDLDRKAKHLEAKLTHQLNVFEHKARKDRENITKYIAYLENALDEKKNEKLQLKKAPKYKDDN